MAMGIFEQLDWLTKKVKQLCCAIENNPGGGCGDCPVTIDAGGSLSGDGTIANPLYVTNPAPTFDEGTFDPTITNNVDCTVSSVNGTLFYTRIGNTFTVWGQLEIQPISGGWSFDVDIPSAVALNSYANAYEATGYAFWKQETAMVYANVGSLSVKVIDEALTISGGGIYNFSYTSKIL